MHVLPTVAGAREYRRVLKDNVTVFSCAALRDGCAVCACSGGKVYVTLIRLDAVTGRFAPFSETLAPYDGVPARVLAAPYGKGVAFTVSDASGNNTLYLWYGSEAKAGHDSITGRVTVTFT